MATRKARPTLEQHMALGQRLLALDEELVEVAALLFHHYPAASPVHSLTYATLEKLRLLREKLSSVSMNDLRGQDVWSPMIYHPITALENADRQE